MKLYFYRGKEPNFGDELNTTLMPKTFPDFFDEDESSLFLGIGSIIFDHHPKQALKVVYGSGYGGYTALPTINETWDIHCVRGPLTAKALGLPSSSVAGDTAILIHKYYDASENRAEQVSFIPHFESIYRGHWQDACAAAGINFIDPRSDVDTVIAQMRRSKLVIAEAMHGAIVSDALRVPWLPILPFHQEHRMKWHDWAGALDMQLKPERLFPSSLAEAAMALNVRLPYRLQNPTGAIKTGRDIADRTFIRLAAAGLKGLAKHAGHMSSDAALSRAIDHLDERAEAIRRQYQKTGASVQPA